MKIILSRKGFDSSSGGVASPITPAGELVSLPIPDPQSSLSFGQLRGRRPSVARWVSVLTKDKIRASHKVHLDPDLDPGQRKRQSDWRPAFGQAGAALGHLDAQGVGVGDLFLFFGWYRQVEQVGKHWRYVAEAPDLHVLFGWLAVGSVWRDPQPVPPRLSQHIHTQREFRGGNAIYSAADNWGDGEPLQTAGAGLWRQHHADLVLTGGERRSQWKLPEWFHPEGRDSTLSYHQKAERWQKGAGCCRLEVAARGQEFVLDCDHYPEAQDWAAKLILSANHVG